jgi:hypothetical protein
MDGVMLKKANAVFRKTGILLKIAPTGAVKQLPTDGRTLPLPEKNAADILN